MLKLIFVFIFFTAVYSHLNQTEIYDLNTQFFSDYMMTKKTNVFLSYSRVYVLFTLYEKKLNTTLMNCLNQTNCYKELRVGDNGINYYAGECPLINEKNLYLIIYNVYLIDSDKNNKYTLYKESSKYYGIDNDTTIKYYKYYNDSYCNTQITFSFYVKNFYPEKTSKLPDLFVKYLFVKTNLTINLTNYQHVSDVHHRKKINTYLKTCCFITNCGFIDKNSCFWFDFSGAGALFFLVFFFCCTLCCHYLIVIIKMHLTRNKHINLDSGYQKINTELQNKIDIVIDETIEKME